MTYALTNLIIEENKRTIVALLQSTHRKGMDNVIRYLNDSGFLLSHPLFIDIITGAADWRNIVLAFI